MKKNNFIKRNSTFIISSFWGIFLLKTMGHFDSWIGAIMIFLLLTLFGWFGVSMINLFQGLTHYFYKKNWNCQTKKEWWINLASIPIFVTYTILFFKYLSILTSMELG